MANSKDLWDYIASTTDAVVRLQERVGALETEVRELRALVTPADPGTLPAPEQGGEDT